MECNHARLLLPFARPGELDGAEDEALRQHLAECPDCSALADAERRADEHLGRAVRDVPVPTGLRERLLAGLAAARPAWHRRWQVRLAAAAVLLLGIGLGYVWFFRGLPAINGGDVHAAFNRGRFSQAEVTQGFADMGVTTVPPPNFDYHLLDSFGMAVLPRVERQVPHLLFLHPGGTDKAPRPVLAHVYILSAQEFDLEQTRRNGVAFLSGTHTVKLEGDEHYLYVIVYTGGSLDAFGRPPQT